MKKYSRVNDITIDPTISTVSATRSTNSVSAQVKQAADQFSEFYRRSKPQDMRFLLQQAHHKRTWLVVTLILTALLVVTASGVWFFANSSGGKFGEEAVEISLSGPPSVPSGQVIELVVSYANNQGVALKDGELNVRYPAGFIFQSAEPAAVNAEGTHFILSRIKSHDKGIVTIRGQLIGQVGEGREFTALFNYQPENLKAEYVKTVKFEVNLVASVLNMEVVGPQTMVAGQEAVFNITYKNSSFQPVSRVLMRITPPAGFELRAPTLESFPDQISTWRVADIPAGESGALEFAGTFNTASLPGEQEFRFAIGLVGEDNHSFTLQEEHMLPITLISSRLSIKLNVNDARGDTAVELGQELNLEATVTNEGNTALNNVEVALVLSPSWLDWDTFRDDVTGSVKPNEGVVRWTSTHLSSLAQLEPHASVTVRGRVRVQSQLPVGVTGNASFMVRGEVRVQEGSGDTMTEIISKTSDLNIKITTHLSLLVEGRYFTDDLIKVGSGPLPPRVGQTTSYVIFWRLENDLNEVENISVTTTLPRGVIWTGQSTVSAGDKITYNSATNEVRWTLNKLPAGAGSTFVKPVANFEVTLTPTEQDIDKILVLTKASSVSGRDSWSGSPVVRTTKFVTTDLDGDPMAEDKGVVVR